jgi:hypothetical protein
MPGIPRLYQRLTEVHTIGQLYRGDQLAAALSGVRGYGVHDDGNRLLKGNVTRELARLRAKGLPAFGAHNPVEVYSYDSAAAQHAQSVSSADVDHFASKLFSLGQ